MQSSAHKLFIKQAWSACEALRPKDLYDILSEAGSHASVVRQYAHPRTNATLLHVIANACLASKRWTAEEDSRAAACVAQIGQLAAAHKLAGTLSTPLHLLCSMPHKLVSFDHTAVDTVFALREARVDSCARNALGQDAASVAVHQQPAKPWLFAQWALKPSFEGYLNAWRSLHTSSSPAVPAFVAMRNALGRRFTPADATAALRWALDRVTWGKDFEAMARATAAAGAQLEADSFNLAVRYQQPRSIHLLRELFPHAAVCSEAFEYTLRASDREMMRGLVAIGAAPCHVPPFTAPEMLHALDGALLAQKPE